jgi:DNA-binding response OmpR family regulator
MRILIVEDDPKLAHQLQRGLAEQGYTARLAFEGHEGLRTARSEPFDVFVLDVMLPGVDGFSLVRRLRASGSVTPILLLTARDTPKTSSWGLRPEPTTI